MRLDNVLKVLRKELRETLRDRRTMLVMVVVPVFLYPALMVIFQQIMLLGQRSLEADPVSVAVAGADPAMRDFLSRDSLLAIQPSDADPLPRLHEGSVDAVVRFRSPSGSGLETAEVELLYDASRERSQRASEVVMDRLEEWGDTLLAARLAERQLPTSFAAPLAVSDSSVASGESMGRYALGRFLPFLLMIMTLVGAFFPAIDLTAGEKERGTLETLLTSPIPNRDIVAGKFVAVALISIATAALNLGSMLLTFQSGLFQVSHSVDLQFSLPAVTVVLVMLFLIPLAVFFAAVCMGIAVRAQSFKEAQNALTPVQFASMIPMYLPTVPGIPFSYAIAVLPIGGLAMLFREMMAGTAPLGPALVAVGSTVLYAGLALRFAARAFGREEVLFGSGTQEAATRSLRERIAEWRAADRQVPRPAQALLLVGLVGLLYFYLGVRLQIADVERGLFLSQWLLLALPAVLFVAAGRYRPRTALALRAPSPRALAAAVLIILGGMPFGWLMGWLQSSLVEVPEEFLRAFQELLTADSTGEFLWLLLLIAVTPAICEELVFRGVLLQGLAGELGKWRAVIGSAVVFGTFHLSYETFIRFLPTAWLGLLIGLVVWQSRSIFAGMLMHFVNNASSLVLVASAGLQAYVVGPEGEPRWLAVGVGAVLLALGLRLLPQRDDAAASRPLAARLAEPAAAPHP